MPSLVTVIIPCFNEEPEFLKTAVASAEGPLSEVIVVNDGSTREDTIDALSALPVQVIHTDNGGPARAMNVAAAAGRGKYIVPLGSDDYLDDRFIETLANAMDADPDLAIAYTDWRTFGRSSQLNRAPDCVTVEDLAARCPIVATIMFRRAAWMALGGFEEGLQVGFEDWEWAFRLLHSGGRAYRVPGAVVHYRLKEASRNLENYTGVEALVATRRAFLANVPQATPLIAEGMLSSIREAYALGQAQSQIAEAATGVAKHWESRFGRLDGALRRVRILDRAWDHWLSRR